jgi:hypothetical protein
VALITADRVKEITTTTGTGSYALIGAANGFRAFSSVCANTDTAYYTATDGTAWEVGLGTWATGGTLARTTILASSNAGSAVNWGAGDKDIFLTSPAAWIGTRGRAITASTTPPSAPSANDLWLDTETATLYVRYVDANSSQWVSVVGATGPQGDPGITVSATAPSGPAVNDLWLDIS